MSIYYSQTQHVLDYTALDLTNQTNKTLDESNAKEPKTEFETQFPENSYWQPSYNNNQSEIIENSQLKDEVNNFGLKNS